MALFLIVILWPVLVVLSLMIVIVDGWPFWFGQDRVGLNGKVFKMWKFRTMRFGAEKEIGKYLKMNESDGPVFKIRNDPRFTKIGKFLSHTGVDEFMQLFNVLKGEMELVGPRPLPVDQRNRINKKYLIRERVLPGIISPWIFGGYHKMSFEKWMISDITYINQKSVYQDFFLCIRGVIIIFKLVTREIIDILTGSNKSD